MVSPNAVFTEIVSTTFRNHSSEITDNFTKHNALYRKLAKGNKVRKESGGYSIVQPLEYAANGTYQRYSGFDVLNVSQSDVFTAAEFNWRQIAINVVSSGYELRVNAGPERIANLAKSRIRNAINTFANNFSADMYGDGTLPDQIDGLQSWWPIPVRARLGALTARLGRSGRMWCTGRCAACKVVALSPVGHDWCDGIPDDPLQMRLTRGNDKPDMWVSSDDYFAFYENSLVGQKRYVDESEANGGFMALQFKGVPVFFDGVSGMPAAHMYALNTNYIELVVHSDANLTVMSEAKPYNQDAVVVPILWMGNMVVSNRSLQGVLKA